MIFKLWNEYFKSWQKIFDFAITVVSLVIVLNILSVFLLYVESRTGFYFNDPILSLFHPKDMTWLIFGLLYFGVILIFFNLFKSPESVVKGIKAYITMIVIRIIVMYLLPLEPPQTMIILKDPIVEFFTNAKPLTKDLFFSGHTATIFLFFLLSKGRKYRISFLIATFGIALGVILQHVHYSIDVLVAPIFAYISKVIADKYF